MPKINLNNSLNDWFTENKPNSQIKKIVNGNYEKNQNVKNLEKKQKNSNLDNKIQKKEVKNKTDVRETAQQKKPIFKSKTFELPIDLAKKIKIEAVTQGKKEYEIAIEAFEHFFLNKNRN